MFEAMLQARHIKKDFRARMKMLGQFKDKQKRYKLSITEEQIGILEYCAAIRVDTFHDLIQFTDIDRPDWEAPKTL